MTVIRNFNEAHKELRKFYAASNIGKSYTLDRIRAVLIAVGSPQEKLRVIHVAGTSGKTSTAYYLSSLLEASGAKVGLTVSPHVDEVNERVQINHTPLPESVFCMALAQFINLVRATDIRLSYFEVIVAFAYWEFARQQVDYAVIEVGLGGLLDGTNVISRSDKVCVITDIGLDHTEILGDRISQIAAQKAGIIQPDNHVFTYQQGSEITDVIQTRRQQQRAQLHLLQSQAALVPASDQLPLFQQRNFYLAVQAAQYVLSRDSNLTLNDMQLLSAKSITIPARMEVFPMKGKTVIIDGSHNSQKITTLSESIRALFPNQGITAVVAFVDGPEDRWQRAIDVLQNLAEAIIVTTFKAEQDVPKRSVDPKAIASYCANTSFSSVIIEEDPGLAFEQLLNSRTPIGLVVGSFYVLNDIRPRILQTEKKE